MKKIYLLSILIIIVSVVLLSSCAIGIKSDLPPRSCLTCGTAKTPADTESANGAYHKITAAEAKQMIDEGSVTIVDVRTAKEYADKHIPGAILVPNESIKDTPPEQLTDKDAVLLVYCRTGIRSKEASDKLVDMGYTQVYDFGGINDWTYETESGNAKGK